MSGPQAALLPDGARLHLHHGPIDLIIGVDGPQREACFARAVARFETVLDALAANLSTLRRPVSEGGSTLCTTATRMIRAVAPHSQTFVTPMAAVAGSVADEILAAMLNGANPPRAYVNNGGDVAFHVARGATFTALGPSGEMRFSASGGVATSGWRGRSYSLGIADAVTVAAQSAAAADVAATLIANAVDLPGHPSVTRQPAASLSPDSDLGARLVTVDVAPLTPADRDRALAYGVRVAEDMQRRGLIDQAALCLQGAVRVAPALEHHHEKERLHA